MTKREAFAQIRTMVAENDELVAFIDHEVELLDKKNSRKSNKPTKAQVANEEIKGKILEYLATTDKARIADIAAELGESPNKINALVKQMKRTDENPTGQIIRTEEKRVAYFSLADTEDEAE
jgi:hypothetical protein